MAEMMKKFKKKFTLALLFWATGTVLAFKAGATMPEYTLFTATILALFKAADVADKRLNGGKYDLQ